MTVTGRAQTGLSHLRSAAAAAAALLVFAAAGCAGGIPAAPSAAGPAVPPAAASAAGQRIVLRFDHRAVTATLADTAAARAFAAQLPLTLDLHDPMGQAKAGRLPAPIDHAAAESVTDPDTGGIYYVPGSDLLAIFYDDLGQAVPAPGLVRLGDVDGDLDAVVDAGNRARVRIDLTDRSSS